MSWFSGNTDSDSKGDSSANEGPTQPRTPSVWSAPIQGTACLPLQPLSMSSTPRPASSHRISLGLYQPETGSPSRESGDRRIHSPWRNSNVPPQFELPAALEPLPITITTLPKPSLEPIPDPNIEITSESEEETFEPDEDNCMEVALMTTPTKYKARRTSLERMKMPHAGSWL